jgi:Integrase core domain
VVVEDWRVWYETERPHSALGYKTPKEVAAGHGTVGNSQRYPQFHDPDDGAPASTELGTGPTSDGG